MFQKVTFTLPINLVNDLNKYIDKGEKSGFVAEAIESELVSRKLKYGANPIERVDQLREKLPKIAYKKMMDSIERGRA